MQGEVCGPGGGHVWPVPGHHGAVRVGHQRHHPGAAAVPNLVLVLAPNLVQCLFMRAALRPDLRLVAPPVLRGVRGDCKSAPRAISSQVG